MLAERRKNPRKNNKGVRLELRRKVTGGNSDVDDMLNNITRTTLKARLGGQDG